MVGDSDERGARPWPDSLIALPRRRDRGRWRSRRASAGRFCRSYYPGSWNEGLSSGQGLMAVALVIFARWDPRRCILAGLLFGGASAISPALQSMGYSQGYYLFNAAALRADAWCS
ncbi:MAG: hypothetical protein U5M50_00015 [Sphingobium sp.]|nr:hypothetical protein [Sphingobium sp.]